MGLNNDSLNEITERKNKTKHKLKNVAAWCYSPFNLDLTSLITEGEVKLKMFVRKIYDLELWWAVKNPKNLF